jgi:hypothetical protein
MQPSRRFRNCLATDAFLLLILVSPQRRREILILLPLALFKQRD